MKSLYLNIDNQTLVQECRSGDRDAMSILYTRFAPRMLRVISRYVNDKGCAQDILHDGFVAAFTRLDTLRDPDRLDFWLATIMKNLSLKFLQAQTVSSILEDIPETTDEPDIVPVLDFETLESLIRQLPDGYQKVFRLAVLEGKSHKEISEILGIAPNSSSSQLFHAKLRLRQLIKDYQLRAGLISILLLILSAGVFFFSRHEVDLAPADSLTAEDLPQEALPQKDDVDPTAVPKPSNQSASRASTTHLAKNAPSVNPHALFVASAEESSIDSDPTTTPVDSVVQSPTCKMPDDKAVTDYLSDTSRNDDLLFPVMAMPLKRTKSWSTAISIDPGLASFKGFGFNSDYESASSSPIRPPQDTEPDDTPDGPDQSLPARASRFVSNSSLVDYLSSGYFSRRHYLPVSFALTAEKRFSSWLGVESGLGYSYLHSDYERTLLHTTEVATCHWHYLEIPLKVNLYAFSSPRFRFYGSLGWKVAIPVYSYASIPANSYCQSGSFRSKAVWSVGGSIGMAYRISKRVDIFIEPSLRYHIPHDCRIPNIWTDDTPWSFSLPIGFRLSW